MAWPTPHSWTSGEKPTSANMQTLTDAILFAQGSATSTGARRDIFRGRNTLGVTLGTSGVAGALTIDVEDFDYANGHSTVTNTSRYVFASAGVAFVKAEAAFTANGTGVRILHLAKNGTEWPGSRVEIISAGSGVPTQIEATDMIQVAAGDYVEAYATQTSGGSLTVASGSLTVELRSV